MWDELLQVQRVIHSHYPAFVEAWEGVGELEIQFQQLKTLITGSCNLVHDLKRASEPAANAEQLEENSQSRPTCTPLQDEHATLNTALEELDVAIAERDLSNIAILLQTAEERAVEVSVESVLLAHHTNGNLLLSLTYPQLSSLKLSPSCIPTSCLPQKRDFFSFLVGLTSINEFCGVDDPSEKGKNRSSSGASPQRSHYPHNRAAQVLQGACRSWGRCACSKLPFGNAHGQLEAGRTESYQAAIGRQVRFTTISKELEGLTCWKLCLLISARMLLFQVGVTLVGQIMLGAYHNTCSIL